MNRSFLICHIGGVPLRLHWAFFLLPLYFLWQPLLHVRSNPEWLQRGLVEMAFLVIAILCHEFAHAMTARRYRATVDAVVLWPLGGFTAVSGMPGTTSSQILLSLSGPLCNLLLGVVASALANRPGALGSCMRVFAWWSLLLGAFNLLPAPLFDGGHALRAALHAKLGHVRGDVWAGRVGIAAAGAIVVLGLRWPSTLVIVIGILAGASSFSLLRQGRFGGYPSERHVPKSGDFRTWRLPKEELDTEIKRQRAIRRADSKMRVKVDELLKQISEKGADSLSEEDRAFLEKAGERLRREGP